MNDQTKSIEPALDYNNLQFHSLANIFPLIEGDEFDAFVEMFRKQGLRAHLRPELRRPYTTRPIMCAQCIRLHRQMESKR